MIPEVWDSDAAISSIRFEDRSAKNFDTLCTLRTDGNWKIIFYSVSSKTELVADLDVSKKKNTELPLIRYEVVQKFIDRSMKTTFYVEPVSLTSYD